MTITGSESGRRRRFISEENPGTIVSDTDTQIVAISPAGDETKRSGRNCRNGDRRIVDRQAVAIQGSLQSAGSDGQSAAS